MSYDSAQNMNGSNSVALGSRIEIFPSQPLPELNSLNGQAFSARYRADATASLYAIVCPPGLPPRIEDGTPMKTVDNPSVLRLVDAGVIAWSGGSRAYALVYQRPVASRMMNTLEEIHPLLSEDSINHHFITPMIGGLIALGHSGIVHNAIRPTNIYWRIGNAAPPQIGECLSAPPGLGQPVIFEPIERALASPLGRGTGIHADDSYAFGVTLAFLVMGRNPLAGIEDQEIIDLKMQRGSFAAIIGNHRLSPTHIEILRGLLADDARQRWSASDLEQWQSGRRMTPKSSDTGRRAARHFDFLGKEYWQVRPLAVALSNNVSEAVKIIENESLNKWLRRAMNDDERANDTANVVSDLKQNGKTTNYEDQLVARVCIALDHAAPIRYRGLSLMPMGISSLLTEAALNGNNIAILSEIIATQLVGLWIEMQKDSKVDYATTGQLFDRMKGLIEKTSFGNGIERITYEANPGLPCLSPTVRNQYVTTSKMLLPALEQIAAGGNRPREPMDRHIGAFLIVRDRRGETQLSSMSLPEGSLRRGLALLTTLSELQSRNGPENLPHLAAWLAPIADSAIRRFISKTLRDNVQKQLKESVTNGDLVKMLRLVDDSKRIDYDRRDFAAARMLYLNIQKEIAGLEVKLRNRDSVVLASGKPMAASISSFLAILLICAAIVRALFGALFP